MIVVGVDPGSRAMGWGVVRLRDDGSLRSLEHGVIRPPTDELPHRLKVLYDGLTEVFARHRPEAAAVEDLFQLRNVRSAIVLAHARAAALLAASNCGIRVFSYAPAVIKLSVTGSGRADKLQVAEMVRFYLSLPERPAEDAADALATAICHALRTSGGLR